jgi:hypothetical protein
LKQVAVCECESDAVTLMRRQFWPGSPEKPTVGFHFKLMDLAETLFLHCQVSVKEFSEIVTELTNQLQPCLVSTHNFNVVMNCIYLQIVFICLMSDDFNSGISTGFTRPVYMYTITGEYVHCDYCILLSESNILWI